MNRRITLIVVALLLVDPTIAAAQSDVRRVEGVLNLRDLAVPDQFELYGSFGEPPSGCSVDESVQRLRALFDAISAESETIVEDFFALPPSPTGRGPFQWYSMSTESSHRAIYDLVELEEYFAQRRDADERLTLGAAQLNRWDNNYAHFGPLLLTRSADDLSPGEHRVFGKAAVDCRSGRVVVMSLSHQRGLPAESGAPSG